MGIGKSKKVLDSRPVVLPVVVLDRGSGTEVLPQPIPKILAESKIRHPLCFFPNQNPPSQHLKLGTGLIISISENEKRRVSWRSQEDNEVGIPARAIAREKLVPKVNQVVHNGPMGDTHLVGSKDRPTFEIGGPSDVGLVIGQTPDQAETQFVNRVDPQPKKDNPGQLTQLLNRVDPQPEKVIPGQLETALTRVRDDGQEVLQQHDSDWNELALQMRWFLQLADGNRLMLPEFSSPRWSRGDVVPPWVRPDSAEPPPTLVNGLSSDGGVGVTPEPTGSHLDSTGLEMVPLQMSDPMLVQPIAMVCPFLEATKTELPKIGFYQNPPSDWLMGQMKAFGDLVGASYESYEEEVITLLQKIELRRPQPRARASS